MRIIYLDNNDDCELYFKKKYIKSEVIYINSVKKFIDLIEKEIFDFYLISSTILFSAIDILEIFGDKIDLSKTYIIFDGDIKMARNLLKLKKINIRGIYKRPINKNLEVYLNV